MKRIICVLLLCICVVGLASCNKSLYDENYTYDGVSLIGKWGEKDYDEAYYFSYEFFEDGKIKHIVYNYGIEVSAVEGTYTAEGNEILIDVVQYDKTTVHYEHKFCITDRGELVIVYLSDDDQMTEKEMVLIPFDVDFNDDNSALVGAWEDKENPGEIWTFNSDYTGKISNSEYSYKMYYSVNGKKLYMAYEFVEGVKQSLVELNYSVNGNTLKISGKIDGEKIEYQFERK